MREILFRGKRVDSGEWVEGWYVPPVEFGGHKFGTAISYICEQSYLKDVEVDPATVGQFTGLTDKNGKRIFEGDVVRVYLVDSEEDGEIVWDENCHKFAFASPDGTAYGFSGMIYTEILGNIYDNPELLDGGDAG